jgi:transposase-like protein
MKKRSYTSDFKAKLVLEVLREEQTLSEIASGYGINPNLLTRWKREFLENAPKVFEKPAEDKQRRKIAQEQADEKSKMLKMIGQLTMERDYLQAATNKLADRGLL